MVMRFAVNLVTATQILGGLLFVPVLPFSLGTHQLMLLKMQRKALHGLKSGGVYIGFV